VETLQRPTLVRHLTNWYASLGVFYGEGSRMRRKGIAGLSLVIGVIALGAFTPSAVAHPCATNVTAMSLTSAISWTGLPTAEDMECQYVEMGAALAEDTTTAAADPVGDATASFTRSANMTPISFSERAVLPFTLNASFNSDLAFQGKHAYQGTYDGFRILDFTDPANPTQIVNYTACSSTAGQGDIVVWGKLLIRSWDSPVSAGQAATARCGGQLVGQGFEGIHIFDISDPANPVMVRQLRMAATGNEGTAPAGCGSHTATAVPDPARGNLYLYNGGSSVACTGMDIVRINIANPTDAVFLRRAGASRQCHDNNVIMGSVNLAMCAGGNGFSVFKFDPTIPADDPGGIANPTLLYSKPMGITTGHSGSFTYDGKVLIFGHEPGGGSQAQCQVAPTTSVPNRTLFFMDPQTGNQLGALEHQRNQTNTENCTWHNFNVVPTYKGYAAIVGSYQKGITAIDFTNPAAPQEIAFADPAPLVHPTNPNSIVLGGDWSTYWYNGTIYESDIRRGLITWKLDSELFNRSRNVEISNPQTQMMSFDPDNTGADIAVEVPVEGKDYAVGSTVTPVFTCTDNVGVESCTGSAATLDTSTTGAHTFTVTAKDLAGNVTTKTVNYNVLHDDADGNVSGTVPGTLSLTVGAPASFGAFTPGVARTYEASTTANVISSAGDATLSVADTAATNAGHLVNGAFVLPQALQARARNAANTGTVYAPISSTPLNLLSYAGPISNDPVSLQFSQAIASTDALRTGLYSKTLVFTLSTTAP
jgi:LVIVD repeat-containing protein